MSPPVAEPPPLRVDVAADVAVTASVGAAWIASELAKGAITGEGCGWCARVGIDDAVRDALRWKTPLAADVASHATAFVLTPAVVVSFVTWASRREGATDPMFQDGLVILESAVLAAGANQIVKLAVRRERPYVRDGGETSADDHVSFYSGHASLTFSLAVAAGTVASMRHLRAAPGIWATGLTLATTTAYLRIAADRHYATDVSVGALVGAAFGFAMPYVFHRPGVPVTPVVTPTAGGTLLLLRGNF